MAGECKWNQPWNCLPDPLKEGAETAKDKVTGAPGELADAAANSAVESFAAAIRDGMEWVIKATLSWWINTDSLSDGSDSIIEQIRDLVLPIAAFVAVCGVMYQGIRMMITRKPDPLIDVARGFWNVALWTAIGVVGPITAVEAGDIFSTWCLEESTKGEFGPKFTEALSMGSVTSAGAMIVLGVLAIIAALVQALLMLLREGAVLALSGVLVLAAAGSFMDITSGWLKKVTAWLLALICYKPAAALIYSVGFILLKDAKKDDPRTAFVGFGMLLLSLVALPAMVKLFNWGVGGLESRGAGLGTGVAAGAAVVHASTSVAGAASGAVDHARFMTQTLGPSAATSGQGYGSSGGPPPAPSGAATAAPAGMQVAQATAGAPGGEGHARSSPAAGAGDTAAAAPHRPPSSAPPQPGGGNS
ncbi:MAG: hypothetical protein ACRER3_00160 [Pseudomonas fluorescens]